MTTDDANTPSKRPMRERLAPLLDSGAIIEATGATGATVIVNSPESKLEPTKPVLHLLRGDAISAENLALLYKQLTGRDATPEEIAEARAVLGEK